MMGRRGFYARGPGNYRWSMARPFHVAFEDGYVRANWDGINALCKFNGIPFDATLEAAGGFGAYTWSLASGTLPSGLTLAEGAISGTPRSAGTFAFVAKVTDAEGRVATYPARVVVADKLAIQTTLFRPAKVGKLYGARVKTSGGVAPSTWHITSGSLPRGIHFDRASGVLSGTPKKAGRYSLTFEATDSLGVVARKTLRLSVIAAPAPKRR